MPVVITDETLRLAGMTEREAAIEVACRLFDIGRLNLWPAAKLAGMSRAEFEVELTSRKIPIHRPTLQDFAEDVETLESLRHRR